MYSIEALRDIIKSEFQKQEYVEVPNSLFEPINYILEDGGKRLRPLLALITYNMYRDDIERAIKSAIGIEIFHNYTLIHDDLMDNAELRRGRQTVHRKWNSNVAILSGDAAAIISYKYIECCEDKYLRLVIDGFNQVAMDVCKGQQYDMDFETRTDVSVEEYINMIYLKTSVLIAGSMRHGALIAGAPENEYNTLYNIGGDLGLAFQLQDDYLDVYGDIKKFGKKIGGDIISNKKTFMLITAYNNCSKADRAELDKWMSMTNFDKDEKIKVFTDIYNRTGVDKAAINLIRQYTDKCNVNLNRLNLSDEKKSLLKQMIDMVSERNY